MKRTTSLTDTKASRDGSPTFSEVKSTTQERNPIMKSRPFLYSLPDELVVNLASFWMPSTPLLDYPHDCIVPMNRLKPTWQTLDAFAVSCKWAKEMAEMIRSFRGFHDFRQLSSRIMYELELKIAFTASGLNSDARGASDTRNASSSITDLASVRVSVAREQALMRYGIDPIVIETSQCPQRAACHLDFDPAMLEGLSEDRIAQSWHRGMSHAVIARDLRTPAQVAGLVQVLKYGQSEVEEFEFTTCTALLDLSSLANALSQCTALRHLAIKTADTFRFELFEAIKMLPILRSLKLEAQSFEKFEDGLAKKIAELRCLSIKSNNGGESVLDALPKIAQYCASVADLRLACGGSKQAGLAIADAITAFHCLQSVTVEGAGDEAAAQIAKAASETASVTRLSFPRSTMTELGSEGLVAILENYHTLEMLLIAAPIGGKAAQVLGRILQAKVCRLRELELRGCDLTEPGIGSIAMGLRSCSSLASFALQSNTITERSASILCNALGSYGNLVKMQTTGGQMLPGATHMFAFVVNQSRTLLDLDLRGNSLREDGARWFANAIEQNRTLLRLEINRNHVSAETTAKIDDGLLKNFQRITL